MKRQQILVIPRWFYPNNLGDSICTTFIPRLMKLEFPRDDLIIYTYGELIDVFSKDPNVDLVKEPPPNFVGNYNFWRSQAFDGGTQLPDNVHVIFAEWHPNLWKYWSTNFDKFYNHPTANLVTVNFLLQLGLEKYLEAEDSEFGISQIDLSPCIYVDKVPEREEKTLGIVPATKLSGRPQPHPGCDGKGLRFNGDSGNSWKSFVERIKELDSDIKIIEFSSENFGFGDVHSPPKDSWLSLAEECAKPTVAVLSDGGMHHVFNSQETPVVLLGAQKINKPYFFKLGNGKFYEDLHSNCLSNCMDTIRNLDGWSDLSNCCDGSCEKVNPVELAEKVYEDYFK